MALPTSLPSDALLLHEELLLLALHDEKGTFLQGTWLAPTLGGALIAELFLHARLMLVPSKKARFTVADTTPLGRPLLDEAHIHLQQANQPAVLSKWVTKLGNLPKLRNRIADNLVARGVLGAEQRKFLLFFERTHYPEADASYEDAVADRLRAAIFEDHAEIAPRTLILLALAHHGRLLSHTFERKALKARKAHIEALIATNKVSEATRAAIEAIEAALIVTTITTTVITTTVTT